MKKGYIRLLIFEFLICIVLFLNSFVWNILSNHIMNIFLLGLIILFRVFFGLEKDRHRYSKIVLMDVFIFLLVFFMLYYLFGIIITFARPGNYFTVEGFRNFILPTFCFVILREYLRYNVMCKASGNKITIVFSIIMFIWIDITSVIFYTKFVSSYNIFMFIALTLMPSISNNIAYSYITLRVGYKPVILFDLVMSLYYYLMPIVPNPNDYLASIIKLFVPLILCYRILVFFRKSRDEEIDRYYMKPRYGWLVFSCAITVMLVYFTSGYFSYWAIAVASGSMSPNINKGDVAIIKKIDDVSKIKKGDVLAFNYENVTIIHRVINIARDGDKYYFYTKGDANKNEDNFSIEEDMIVGITKVRVPWVGIPTVWLNEL